MVSLRGLIVIGVSISGATALGHETILQVPGAPGEGIGTAVTSLGDIDGDDVADFAGGGALDDASGIDAGVVRVFSGMTGAALYTVHGAAAGARFGSSLSSLPDHDGDGVRELLVGAPGSGATPGQVFLLSGAAGTLLHTFTGTSADDGFGVVVAGGGDLNGDGAADIAVGSPRSDVAAPDAGRVVAYSGNGFGELFAVNGAAAGDRFGTSLDVLGDFDGDGFDDVVIGAPLEAVPAGSAAGKAYVFSGATGAVLLAYTKGYPGEHYGSMVSAAGDYDGDGFVDAVECDDTNSTDVHTFLGGPVPQVDFIETSAGKAIALRGIGDVNGDGGDDIALTRPSDPGNPRQTIRVYGRQQPWGFGAGKNNGILAIYEGPSGVPDFGLALAAAGDIDHDGFADILAGAPNAGASTAGGGEVRIVTVAGLAPRRRIFSPAFEFEFGKTLASVGDLNGDAIPDIAVASYDGLDPSQKIGRVRILSGLDGAIFQSQLGTPMAEFGGALGALGDLDGDGVPDYAIGSPDYDGWLFEQGFVRCYSGATGTPLYTVMGVNQKEYFGSDVKSAGDVNVDGVLDLIASAPLFANRGIARVLSGTDGSELLSILGSATGDEFGRAVRGGVDLNGDGRVDLVIGAPKDDEPLIDQGTVRAFSGATGAQLWMRRGVLPADLFGNSLDTCTDLDQDGVAEVLAAGSNALGRVFSGNSGTTVFEVPSIGLFGANTRIRNAGDQNGDGRDDIATAHPGAWWNGESSGVVGIHSTVGGELLGTFALEISDAFGAAIDGAGDLDGDGTADLVIGAPSDAPSSANSSPDTRGSTSFFALRPSGISTYGEGCPGERGFVPRLLAIGAAHPGAQISLRGFDGRGAATAFLFVGTQPASLPVGGGCHLLVSPGLPPVVFPLLGHLPGTGAFKIDFDLPSSLPTSIQLYVQFFVLDATAVPAAASNAVRLSIE